MIKKARSEANLTARLPTVKVSESMRQEVDQIVLEDDVSIGDIVREGVEMLLIKRRKANKTNSNAQQDS
jgi:hypothetical protein